MTDVMSQHEPSDHFWFEFFEEECKQQFNNEWMKKNAIVWTKRAEHTYFDLLIDLFY